MSFANPVPVFSSLSLLGDPPFLSHTSCHCHYAFVPLGWSHALQSKRLKPVGSWQAGISWGRGESWHWAICLVDCSVQGAPHYLEGFPWCWLGLAFLLLRTSHNWSELRVWSPPWHKGKGLFFSGLQCAPCWGVKCLVVVSRAQSTGLIH